jgi:hypothetical protein
MKKLLLAFLLLTSLTLIASSCKSSGGHCDAYGNRAGKVKH